jgi:hypothetical protein
VARGVSKEFWRFSSCAFITKRYQNRVIDYITKIVGGALTFGLLIIAFRRKFERKYTR